MPSQNSTPYGFCQCGCGKLAPISTQNRAARRQQRGHPVSYIYGHRKMRPTEAAQWGAKWSAIRALRSAERRSNSAINESAYSRLWSQVDSTVDGCWLWRGARDKDGYGRTSYGGRKMVASRAVWFSLHGPLVSAVCVCHHCDNPPCCNPAHLFTGSKADNNADMVSKGRQKGGGARGERAPSAKLREEQVKEIRTLRGSDFVHVIAARFGVSRKTISNIWNSVTWR